MDSLDSMNALGQVPPLRRTGNECLPSGGKLLDFWQWMGSNLLSNATRGVFAEYLVSLAVGSSDECRDEWAPYDVMAPSEIKIEVKTSAFIQAWPQMEYSRPQFDIAPKRLDNSNEVSRSSDVYVFCLLHHRIQATIDPLNMSQWTFYVLSTKALTEQVSRQKSIGLSRLPQIGAMKVHFDELEFAIRRALSQC